LVIQSPQDRSFTEQYFEAAENSEIEDEDFLKQLFAESNQNGIQSITNQSLFPELVPGEEF
jgi:hypothetical protein